MLLIVLPCIPDLYSERSFMYSPHKLASHMRKYSISARHGISYCTQHIEAYFRHALGGPISDVVDTAFLLALQH